MNFVPSSNGSILLFDDWNLLTNIQNAYEDYCIEPFLASHKKIPLIITTQPYRSRIKLQRIVDIKQKYIYVIASFVKRVLQNSVLTENDYEYIKNNFTTLLSINTCELMKSNVLKHVPWENDRFLFESVLTENILQRVQEHYHVYETLLPYDPLVMRLFLFILALSSRASPLFKKEQYNSTDFHPFPKQLVRAQNFFSTLLWKYVIYRLGYYDAIMYSVRFIQHFLRRQTIEADITDILYKRDDHGQLIELFQTATNTL